jgi:aminopeptidase YwaD
MKRIKFTFLIFLLGFQGYAQNLKYAKHIVDTLCSETFHGRGYAKDGVNMAAEFIAAEYFSSGILQFNNTWFQEFSIPMNVIHHVKINNKTLKAGDDYVIHLNCTSSQGKYKTVIFDPQVMGSRNRFSDYVNKDHSREVIVVLPSVYENAELRDVIHSIVFSDIIKAAGFIFGVSAQPGWNVQLVSETLSYPVFTIKGSEDFFLSMKKFGYKVQSTYNPEFRVSNVCGYVPGTLYPDSFIVLCAHYDHLGLMGNVMYPGANDNASGTALLLNLAYFFSDTANRLPYSVAFLSLTAEEAGILGADYFVKNPLFQLSNVKFLLNLDIIGTGKEGIQVVNGSVFQKEFDLLSAINEENQYLTQVKIRGEACNSDHCPFYKAGVPSFFIYTLDKEYPWYHVPQDEPARLPLTAYENLFRLITDFCVRLGHKNE